LRPTTTSIPEREESPSTDGCTKAEIRESACAHKPNLAVLFDARLSKKYPIESSMFH
jgi:hypothetical protein